MNDQLGDLLGKEDPKKVAWEKTKKVRLQTAKHSIPGIVKLATANVINIDEMRIHR